MLRQGWLSRLPSIATGLRGVFKEGYSGADLRQDLLAGITLGTIAVPLSMALAIAVGVPPQHGLYTAIIAGAVIALAGGSRFNVSGPTAAFVVILLPIVQKYGIGGLLLATLMAGAILVAMGLGRLGRLISFVPYPVVLGFTTGIAVVIATLQVPDFLGLVVRHSGEHFSEHLIHIVGSLGQLDPLEFGVGLFTLAVLLGWPRLRTAIPAPLVGLAAAAAVGALINQGAWFQEFNVATIASRFTWSLDGVSGTGIPPVLPQFAWPWNLPGPDGQPLVLSFALVQELLAPAFAIAMLGAIESLLCAVVADGLTRTRHDPNAELIGQGLGNMLAPLFGGITATAAIARTATNIRSGARSPIAAVIHALVVLLTLVALAGLLGQVPMAALAALLLVTAWNMSEVRHFMHTLRSAPAGDVAILLVCFALTVLFDMVLAVGVGIGLAAALFIRRMALLSTSERVDPQRDSFAAQLPAEVALYDVNGALFFGAAERALSSLWLVDRRLRLVILDMRDVPSIDATAMHALQSVVDDLQRNGVGLIMVGLPSRIIAKMRRAGIRREAGRLSHCRTLEQAGRMVSRWLPQVDTDSQAGNIA